MDDCGLSSPTDNAHSPGHKANDESDDHIIVDSSLPSSSSAVSSSDHHRQHLQSHQPTGHLNSTQLSLVSNYNSSPYYGTGRSIAPITNANYSAPNNIVDPYSSYPSSRYSTASSTQYSSLGRSGAVAGHLSTQIQVPQPSSSQNTSVLQGSTIRPSNNSSSGGNHSVIVENNDCYLLTAQPVRVDSTCSSSSATSSATLATSSNSSQTNHHDLQHLQNLHNHNMMTSSLDSTSAASLLGSTISSNTCNSTASSSAAMFNSLLSSSSATSASETIAGIVWPSMHQLSTAPSDLGGTSSMAVGSSTLEMTDSPPNSLMIHTPLMNRAALAGNEIVVTGNEQQVMAMNGAQIGKSGAKVPELHLTDEGLFYFFN